MKYINPILTKQEERKENYKEFKWSHFLILKKWADDFVKDNPMAKVCLVGSVLIKEVPRDVDLSVIIPVAIYEELYGSIPDDLSKMNEYMTNVWYSNKDIWLGLYKEFNGELWIDFKVCPDVWFEDKPRLVIASGIES